MGDVTKGEGRTVLFVSHNMAAVKTFVIMDFIRKWLIKYKGSALETVIEYQKGRNSNDSYFYEGSIENAIGNENIRIKEFSVKPLMGGLHQHRIWRKVKLIFITTDPI
jgi:lipopolysaccharide transport system ATP-binding protein